MNFKNKGLQNLLNRTTLSISFKKLLNKIENQYPSIKEITDFEPILQGYEDANILLFTNKGKYVLKIFLKERSLANIKDYAKVIRSLMKIKVPTIPIIKGSLGYLSFSQTRKVKTYYIITKFIEGYNFQESPPNLHDMVVVARHIAKLNTFTFKIQECYDSWGNKNFLKEFTDNKDKINSNQLKLIQPIFKAFKQIDFDKLSESVIHGDMQKKHVIKSEAGNYHLIDFGCMSYAPKVIEISTFLAWFCLDKKTWKQKSAIIKKVINEYAKIHSLSDYELASIVVLTKASWSTYYLKTSILMKEGDNSSETKEWHKSSKTMLNLSKDWKQTFD